MTESVARIIAAVVAIGVVCCAVALIVAVHNDEGSDPGTGNVTPEGSPTGLNLPGDISRNATPQQVPQAVQGGLRP